MTYKLSPSILAADMNRLGEQLEIIKDAGADYVHIDVMDGVVRAEYFFWTARGRWDFAKHQIIF